MLIDIHGIDLFDDLFSFDWPDIVIIHCLMILHCFFVLDTKLIALDLTH